MRKARTKEHQERSKKAGQKIELAGIEDQVNRARSVSVGTCFGGVIELSMRSHGGVNVWCPLQPIEIVELIHQLSASVGCHINVQPRSDFASWREWNHSEEELAHYRGLQPLPGVGHPPHGSDMAPHQHIAAELPEAGKQPGINKQEKSNDREAVGIEEQNH
jgi:hypothetical protein